MQGSAFAPQSCTPLVFFHPKPEQVGILDSNYGTFVGTNWESLWERYTRKLGAQIASSGAKVILILPHYRTARMNDFGNLRSDCANVISSVITAAADAMDITALRKNFQFDRYMTGSFSNGLWAQMEFLNKCFPNDHNRLCSIL